MEKLNSRTKPVGQANPGSFNFAPEQQTKLEHNGPPVGLSNLQSRMGGTAMEMGQKGNQVGVRVRQLNNKAVTPQQMMQSKIPTQKMGGTMQNNFTKSRLTQDQLQRSQHAMSKESLLKAPGKLGVENASKLTTQTKPTILKETKPYNRLVPVPPPQGFITAMNEEPKMPKIQNLLIEEEKKQKVGTADSSTGRTVASAYGNNRSRISTAKSTTSLYSTEAKQMSTTQQQFYLEAKRQNRVVEDDTLSVAESTQIDKCLMQQNVLFDPNEIVEDNSMVAMIVKQNVNLLQRCLKSKNTDLYFAAIDSVINSSENFGPALNKHLPIILPLVAKRQDLSNDDRILTLQMTLRENGGREAEKMLEKYPLN